MDGWNQERERRRIIIFLEEEICENAQLKRNGVRTEQGNKTTEKEKLHCVVCSSTLTQPQSFSPFFSFAFILFYKL